MANPYAILNEFVRFNSEAASFQRERINELLIKDFPFSDSELFVNALRKINEEIIIIFHNMESQINELNQSNQNELRETDDNPYDEIHDNLIIYAELMWNIGELIHHVEASGREHVSQSTVYLVSYLTKQHEQSSSFFLTPLNEHNFQYRNLARQLRELIKDSIPSADAILKELNQNFSILSFPGIYRDNVVANILLAHEVGHFIVDVNGLESKITPKVKINSERLTNYSKKLASIPLDSNKKQTKISDFVEEEQIKTKVSKDVSIIIQRWIRELLSDMIGFMLSGPVFIFALSNELLSIFPHGLANRKYPPPSLRLKLILDELEKRNFLSSLDGKYRDNVKNLVDDIKLYINTPSIQNNDELLEVVREALESVIPEIVKLADESTQGLQYTPELFAKEIPVLLDKLKNVIPPCEISRNKPANIISILNAGMIYKMVWRKDEDYIAATTEDVHETEQTINALVLRSIEMSILEEQFLTHLEAM